MNIPQQMRAKYPADRYALFFEVPDAVSLDARRRIDAVAVGIWKSVGRNITGFEFKASRSDWLREVKQVDKADPFISICDYFFLVTHDTKIAKIEEIPECWGWMTCTEHGLRVQRPATKLPQDKETLPWGFTVGLLRKLQDSLLQMPDVRVAIEDIHKAHKADMAEQIKRAVDRTTDGRALKHLQDRVDEFEKKSGIKMDDWDIGSVADIVKSLKAIPYTMNKSSGADFVAANIERQAEQAENVAAMARKIVAELRKGKP